MDRSRKNARAKFVFMVTDFVKHCVRLLHVLTRLKGVRRFQRMENIKVYSDKKCAHAPSGMPLSSEQENGGKKMRR
jgi:hypothetical protein